MTRREQCLAKFAPGSDSIPTFLPDLDIWHKWHVEQDTVPPEWDGRSLESIYRALSIPILRHARPWLSKSEYAAEVSTDPDEKRISIDVDGTLLTSRWTRGPDGDWWQTDYPAKTTVELEAVRRFVQSRSFEPQPEIADSALAQVGDDGVVFIDLPARPFSWLMLEMIGWSEGLMLLLDAEDLVREIVNAADQALQTLVSSLRECQGVLFHSPDNLDGQFVSPTYFDEFLAPSYRQTTDVLAQAGKHLIVHAGGPAGSLLSAMADVGIGGAAGVCGPPQGDTPLDTARERAGDNFALIGGIEQDVLLPGVSTESLDTAVDRTIAASEGDPSILASVADHVPIDAEIYRLKRIASRF